jgi:hypothetical protein
MDKSTTIAAIIIGTVFELVALFVIVRLWLRRRMPIVPRIIFSIILLVPFFGLMIFAFIGIDLDKNPDKEDTQSDRVANIGGGDGN